METNDHVRIRNQLDGRWAGGFRIAREVQQPAGEPLYEVVRVSDGSVLPSLLPASQIRRDGPARP